MTDTTPDALRALAYRLRDIPSLTALTAADTLRKLAAEKEGQGDLSTRANNAIRYLYTYSLLTERERDAARKRLSKWERRNG